MEGEKYGVQNMKDFDIIYEKYFKEVYYYTLKITKNEIIAEDIVSETFLSAIKNIEKLKDTNKIKTWLISIAKNKYFDYIKKNTKHIPLDEIDVAYISAEDIFIDKDDSKRIRMIIHKLKEPYKEVFFLRVFANLSFKEIAEIFDNSESTVRQIFHRAKIMIKENL
jgi:RNA polymerase sigma-70 factor (ECF subfamily)